PKITTEGRITQKAIADQLGVSRQLVGFALRGEGRMSDALRQKILEVARQNGYHQFSNGEARLMVSRRYGKRVASGVLAVLFHATFEGQPLSSVPFFTSFFIGLENEAKECGIELVLCPLRSDDLPLLVRESWVDGVICLLTPEAAALRVRELALPVLSIQYEAPGVPSLLIDESGGTTLTTRHLLELGHRRIAYLGLAEKATPIAEQRLTGYLRALHENGLPVAPELLDVTLTRTTMQAGADAMERMLRRCRARQPARTRQSPPGFSALVCYNDMIAMGAIRVLKEAGWQVPADVSVAGFDDVSVQHGFSPALTSVSFPRQEMGRRAVQLLCDQHKEIANADCQDQIERFPVRLVVRDSTAPAGGVR
ncbi:MAG: LacI family transcriptional regulator, partial [Armatimonadota bacterium]|nr:LacI family transcriptional regulator [Armatimonadota bacterium]